MNTFSMVITAIHAEPPANMLFLNALSYPALRAALTQEPADSGPG